MPSRTSGALSGAATGAAAGAAFGPWGAAIGGVGGGLLGYFSTPDDPPPQYQDRDQILKLISQGYGPGGLTSQQAPQLQMGNDPFRAAQLQQMGQLQGIASGQQQGAGELAAQRQYQNAIAAQQGIARMARGGNAALAYRNAANQSAALGSSAAGMGQQAALQDQMNAQGMLGQVGAAGRQGDFGVANANAGYQANAQALNSQNYMGLLNSLSGMSGGQIGAQAAQAAASQQRNDALLGAGISAGGQILAQQMANQRQSAAPASVADSGYRGTSVLGV
jgi:hypothetical protein